MATIRAARKVEVKDLQSLNDKVFIDNQKYDPDVDMSWALSDKGKEYFTELLSTPQTCCLIAEENGKKIGYIAARTKIVPFCKSNYIEIENMGVLPEHRSKGVGIKLMKEMLKWSKSRGFQKAYVTSYFANKMAVEFYKKNGFSEIDISLQKNI